MSLAVRCGGGDSCRRRSRRGGGGSGEGGGRGSGSGGSDGGGGEGGLRALIRVPMVRGRLKRQSEKRMRVMVPAVEGNIFLS